MALLKFVDDDESSGEKNKADKVKPCSMEENELSDDTTEVSICSFESPLVSVGVSSSSRFWFCTPQLWYSSSSFSSHSSGAGEGNAPTKAVPSTLHSKSGGTGDSAPFPNRRKVPPGLQNELSGEIRRTCISFSWTMIDEFGAGVSSQFSKVDFNSGSTEFQFSLEFKRSSNAPMTSWDSG